MKKIVQTFAEGMYEAPSCSVVEIMTEGVLCGSNPIDDWEENEDVL